MTVERMSNAKAREFERKLFYASVKPDEIAAKLAEAGYLSIRTGKPLRTGGVYSLLRLNKHKQKAATAKAATAKAATKTSQKLQLIHTICAQTYMSADDRIAAIMLMTGG